jgi:signal transduction histidine kinase
MKADERKIGTIGTSLGLGKILKLFACLSIFFLFISVSDSFSQTIQNLHDELRLQPEGGKRVAILLKLASEYKKEKAFDKSLEYYEQALRSGKENLSEKEQIEINQNIATTSKVLKKYDRAIRAYLTIQELHKETRDSSGIITTTIQLAQLYEKSGQTDAALKRYEVLLGINRLTKSKEILINIYNNIGSLYLKNENYSQSLSYFLKSLQLFQEAPHCLKPDEQTILYLNIGTNYSALKENNFAEKYFKKAQVLQKENPLKIAEIKTYLASNYILTQNNNQAIAALQEAIDLSIEFENNSFAEQILLKSYNLIAKVYEGRDNVAYNKYVKLYQKLSDELNKRERQSQKANFDTQLNIEKKENQLLAIIAEKEKAEKRNIQLENDAKEKELLLKNKELDLLKRDQDLHRVELKNQSLEKESLAQILKVAEERLEAEDQKRKAIQHQLEAEKAKAENARQQKELVSVSKEKELQAQQLNQARMQTRLWVMVFILMLLLLIVIIILFARSHKHRVTLAIQNKFIQQQHQEIEEKNEELILKQQEVLVQSDWLILKNEELRNAQITIQEQNEQLKLYNENLEADVAERTLQLTETNGELVKNIQQLEQFAYIVAHNLRGPVARLLGLSLLFEMAKDSIDDKEFIISKIKQEIVGLDNVIADLNIILQVKKGMENEVENIQLDEKLASVMASLKDEIIESGTRITSDFSKINQVTFIHPYLYSILYNLISNAIKYRSPLRDPIIKISSEITDDYTICLKISDNGLGMDLEKYGNNVFGLYKRFHLHKEGKGMGLYLVKTQIEMMGGKIEIESQQNVGTTFNIYFSNKSAMEQQMISDKKVV